MQGLSRYVDPVRGSKAYSEWSELVQRVTGKDEYMIGYEPSSRHSNSYGPHVTDRVGEAGH